MSSNQFSGTLDQQFFAEASQIWQCSCSENLWEGTLPQRLPRTNHAELFLWSVSSKVGARTRLGGALPQALGRARQLTFLMAHNQVLEGNVQALSSSLRVLALHANLLKSLSGIAFAKDHAVILLHHNLLSCHLPKSGHTVPDLSLVAIGNHLRHPGDDFPGWVSPIERDDLFWTSEWEFWIFFFSLLACGSFFMLVASRVIGLYNLQCMVVSWCSSTSACSHGISRWHHLMACQALRSTSSFLFLFDWGLYLCPRSLALASACLHQNGGVHLLVLLLWMHPIAWSTKTSQGMLDSGAAWAVEEAQRLTLKRCLLWFLWLQLTVLLSSLVVLDLAGKSVPGLFSIDRTYFKNAMSQGMGIIQGLLSSTIIPRLARKFAFSRYSCTRPDGKSKVLKRHALNFRA